jgi:NAD(P)-dependent dehydrogenase (short-subunit alcohol dehydrogenase family)
VAQELKAHGWQVVAVSRDGDALEGIADCGLAADVADPFAVQRAVLAAGQEVGEVQLYVYAAGDILAEPVGEMAPQSFRRMLDANLIGAFNTAHYSLPLLSPDATLVFIGAVSERMRLPGLSGYAAAKAGLEAFAEALRKEERKRNVLVVRPAAVDTAFWKKTPFKLPANALSPLSVAQRIVGAVANGQQGVLDIT